MKHIDDLFKQVARLWDEGDFLKTAYIDGKGVSLYKLDGSYHLIWYNAENAILKYESIEEKEIDHLFSNSTISEPVNRTGIIGKKDQFVPALKKLLENYFPKQYSVKELQV
jgi:hypothetical protein